jgi:hypothetical protein
MRDELRKAIIATKGLTSEELGELRSHIAALLSLGPSSADGILSATNHDDWVLMGIADYMRSNQLDLAGVAQLTSGKHYDTFKTKLPGLHAYLKKSGNKTQQRAILKLGIGLLHHDLANIGLAVSSRLIMSHIHRLPGVINRAFPGYAQAGRLHMLFRSENDVRKKSHQPSHDARGRTAKRP